MHFVLLLLTGCSLLSLTEDVIVEGIDAKLEKKIERIIETKAGENTMARPPEIRRDFNRRNRRTRQGHGQKRYDNKAARDAYQTFGKRTNDRDEKVNGNTGNRYDTNYNYLYSGEQEGQKPTGTTQCMYETIGGMLRKRCREEVR